MSEAICHAYSLVTTIGATVITPVGLLGIVSGHGTVALELLDLLDEAGEQGIEAAHPSL